MINVKKEVFEVKDDDTPALHVVVAVKGAGKKASLSAPLVLPFAQLYPTSPGRNWLSWGWSYRAIRLAGNK